MTLEDRLERLAHRTPPRDPAEVLAAARQRADARPDTHRPRTLTAAVAAAAVVVALAAGAFVFAADGGDSLTVTGSDNGEDSARSDVYASVSVSVAGMGPFDASVSPLEPEDTAWMRHTVTLENTGEDTIYVRDLRTGTFLGDNEVATATQGCGYGPDSPLGLRCLSDLPVVTVEPGGAHTFTVALWRDLPGMNPVGDGPYDWGVPVSYSTEPFADPDDVGTRGTVTLTYENLTADLPADGERRPVDERGGVDGPVLYGPESDGLMEDARLAGQLVRDGDCLYLLQDSDAGRYAPLPVVWPHGAYWDRRPDGVRLADGTGVPVGALFEASGGVHDIGTLTEHGHHPDVAGRARECASNGVDVVAYVQGEVTLTRPAPDRLSVPESGASAQQLSDGTPVWVVRHDDGTVSVVDAVSTHAPYGAGTLVAWCQSSQGFIDPMYGSTYDEHGRKQGGPAPRGLDKYPVFGVDDNTVTVPGPPVEQPRQEEGGPVASEPAGPHCFDSAGHIPGVIEGWFENHPVGSMPPVDPADAMNRSDGTVVVLDAPVVIVAGRQPTVCTSPPAGTPPSCDGVPALGLFPQDDDAVVLSGTFLARVHDRALTDIVYVSDRTLTT